MTTNEIIKEIAVYDGWEIDETRFTYYVQCKNKDKIKYCCVDKKLDLSSNHMLHAYLTDLNILHRVAVKVYGEIMEHVYEAYLPSQVLYNKIVYSIFKPPINGEYITLATATAEAIVYLKSHKP
jgi:hypothetical protein